jgi:hypothetical protein
MQPWRGGALDQNAIGMNDIRHVEVSPTKINNVAGVAKC